MTDKELKEAINKFILDIQGRYKEHVSDDFLKAYLHYHFVMIQGEWTRKDKSIGTSYSNIAYLSSIKLFERFLEYGCKVGGNGHHVAQNYSSYFSKFDKDD